MDQVRGKGDMIFDIDCGERGSEAGGRRWRKSSNNSEQQQPEYHHPGARQWRGEGDEWRGTVRERNGS